MAGLAPPWPRAAAEVPVLSEVEPWDGGLPRGSSHRDGVKLDVAKPVQGDVAAQEPEERLDGFKRQHPAGWADGSAEKDRVRADICANVEKPSCRAG